MGFIKKQGTGVWTTFFTLCLGIISYIIYRMNIAGEGYFQNSEVKNSVLYLVIAVVLMVAVLVISQLRFHGVADTVVSVINDGIRIIIPALVIVSAVTLISGRVEGFAFIYFSNEEVLQEVQTAANLSSAHGAIANIIALVVTAVAGMVSAFFSAKNKEA